MLLILLFLICCLWMPFDVSPPVILKLNVILQHFGRLKLFKIALEINKLTYFHWIIIRHCVRSGAGLSHDEGNLLNRTSVHTSEPSCQQNVWLILVNMKASVQPSFYFVFPPVRSNVSFLYHVPTPLTRRVRVISSCQLATRLLRPLICVFMHQVSVFSSRGRWEVLIIVLGWITFQPFTY